MAQIVYTIITTHNKMKKVITSLIIVLCVSFVYSQNDRAATEKMVNEFTIKLEERGINDWFVVNRYCLGTNEMFQMKDGNWCSSKETYYEFHVLWKEGDKTMVKKIDNCGLFMSMPLSDNDLWEFVLANTTDLQKKSVKPYEGENITGQPEARTAIHPCYREFIFSINDEMYDQKFNLYQLTTEEEHPNKNYEFNNQLPVVELNKLMDPIMDTLKNTMRRQE